MVTIEGRARRPQKFQLPHDLYCEVAGECRCETVQVRSVEHNPRTGDRAVRLRTFVVPGTVTIPYKQTVELDSAILSCPGVKAGLFSRPPRLRQR